MPSETQNYLTPCNQVEVKKYFDFISSSGSAGGELFCGCWMDSESKEPLKGLGAVFRTCAGFLKEYESLRLRGVGSATLHVTVNKTNLGGRRRDNIELPRVFVVDIDHVSELKSVLALAAEKDASMVVESSPGKFHIYWKCKPIVTLESWVCIQAGLASVFKGDTSFSEITKIIRVPGFGRACKDGSSFTPRIVYQRVVKELGEKGLLKLFPGIIESGQKALGSRRLERKERIKTLVKSVQGEQGEQREQGEQDKKDKTHINNKRVVGERNETLYETLKQFILEGNGSVSEESVLEYAFRLNEGFMEPLDEREVTKTAGSAWRHGVGLKEAREARVKDIEKKKEQALENGERALEDLEKAPKALKALKALKVYKYDYSWEFLAADRFCTMAVVERVLQRFGDMIVRVGDVVYAFDRANRIWKPQKGNTEIIHGFVHRCCLDTVYDPQFEASMCTTSRGEISPEKRKQAVHRFCGGTFATIVVNKLMQWEAVRSIDVTDFDSNNLLFYCKNGVLDLKNCIIREAQAEDYLLCRSNATWSGGECPGWKRFLEEVFAENDNPAEMIRFIQELFGYSLTGSVDAQKIFIHYGDGCNGKSKVLDCLHKICGTYATKMNCTSIAKSKNAIAKELDRIGAQTEGKRVVILDDLDTKSQWNEGLVKNLTGDTIVARKLYEEVREIPNRAKFHIGCNEIPSVEGESEGIIRRICVVPYPRKFPALASKEAELKQMVEREMSAIISWAIEGLKRVIENKGNLRYPEEVEYEVKTYRNEQFILEGIVSKIFAIPSEDNKNNCKVNLENLMTELERKLAEVGAIDRMPSRKSLGNLLKKFGFERAGQIRSEKNWKEREMYYFVEIVE